MVMAEKLKGISGRIWYRFISHDGNGSVLSIAKELRVFGRRFDFIGRAWPGKARHGAARHGKAGQGWARRGRAWQGKVLNEGGKTMFKLFWAVKENGVDDEMTTRIYFRDELFPSHDSAKAWAALKYPLAASTAYDVTKKARYTLLTSGLFQENGKPGVRIFEQISSDDLVAMQDAVTKVKADPVSDAVAWDNLRDTTAAGT